MSNITNSNLLERAYELLEEITSHPSGLDKALTKAVRAGNLDEIYYLVTKIESELAQKHFYNNNISGN